MTRRVTDDLKEIYDDVNLGVPARRRELLREMVRGLVVDGLATHETGDLAVEAGLGAGNLFKTSAGALMVVGGDIHGHVAEVPEQVEGGAKEVIKKGKGRRKRKDHGGKG